MSASKDWWVRRTGLPVLRGEKKDLGPFTHREARSHAFRAYRFGWSVELERRDAKGGSSKVVVPVFPRAIRGSRPDLAPVVAPKKDAETLVEAPVEA